MGKIHNKHTQGFTTPANVIDAICESEVVTMIVHLAARRASTSGLLKVVKLTANWKTVSVVGCFFAVVFTSSGLGSFACNAHVGPAGGRNWGLCIRTDSVYYGHCVLYDTCFPLLARHFVLNPWE